MPRAPGPHRWGSARGEVLVKSYHDEEVRQRRNVQAEDGGSIEALYPMATWGTRDGERFFGAVPGLTKFLFVFPIVGYYAMAYLKTGFITPFYTDDYPKASLSVIALFKVVAVLCDAAWDPAVANWSDASRSRFGRRRPFLLIAAVVCPVAMMAGFMPPETTPLLAGLWFGVCDSLFSVIGASMQFVAYDALGAEMTPDYKERTKVWSLAEIGTVCGILLGSTLPALVSYGPNCNSTPCDGCVLYFGLAAIFGVGLFMLPQFGLVAWARERPQQEESRSSMGVAQTIVAAMCNWPFRLLIVSDIVEGVGANLPMIVLPYVLKWVIGWRSIEEAGLTVSLLYAILAGGHLLTRVPFTFIWRMIALRLGKVKTYLIWNFLFAIQMLAFLYLGEGTIVEAIVLGITWGVVYAGHWLLKDIMSSVIDYDEFLTGCRREGQYYMILELIPKIMEVPTEALPFLLMSYFGYSVTSSDEGDLDCSLLDSTNVTEDFRVESQPLGVVWTIRLSFAAVPGIFGLLSGLVLLKFPLRTEAQHEAIFEGIQKHKSGEAALDPVTGKMVPAITHGDDGSVSVGDRSLSAATYGQLSYFFPSELQQAITAGKLSALGLWMKITSAVMVLLVAGGLYVMVAGFKDFVEGHFSITPIGVVMLGMGGAVLWFQVTRLLQLRAMIASGVTLDDVRFMLELRTPVPPLFGEAPAPAAAPVEDADASTEQQQQQQPQPEVEAERTLEVEV